MALCSCLSHAQAKLQATLAYTNAQADIAETTKALQNFEQWRFEDQRLSSYIKWRAKDDCNSPEFYDVVRQRSTQTSITKLKDLEGRVLTRQADLEAVCWDFYSSLYIRCADSPLIVDAQAWAFDGTYCHFSSDMVHSLDRPIFLAELSKALAEMANQKSP
jgi:hypothetical protein